MARGAAPSVHPGAHTVQTQRRGSPKRGPGTARRSWRQQRYAIIGIAAITLSCAVGGACTIQTTEHDNETPGHEELLPVRWNLSEPADAADLPGTTTSSDTMAVVEHGAGNTVTAAVQLPDNITVDGRWADIAALNEGSHVRYVYFTAAPTTNEADWSRRIDDFAAAFGGDIETVDAFIEEARAELAAGEVVTARTFPGNPRPGVAPALELRPGGGTSKNPMDMVVEWHFTLR